MPRDGRRFRSCTKCLPAAISACKLRHLEIGCGTGRFLDLVKQVWPRLPSPGLDLSEPYIPTLDLSPYHMRSASSLLKTKSDAPLMVQNNELTLIGPLICVHDLHQGGTFRWDCGTHRFMAAPRVRITSEMAYGW
jgi:hypothetical protein